MDRVGGMPKQMEKSMNGRNDDEPTTLEDHARQEALTTHFPSLGYSPHF